MKTTPRPSTARLAPSPSSAGAWPSDAQVAEALGQATKKGAAIDIEALQRVIRRAAGRFVKKRTKRQPMIVPVVVEI